MAVRKFGNPAFVRTTIGKANPDGPFTVAALLKRGGDNIESVFARTNARAREAENWDNMAVQQAGDGLAVNPANGSGYVIPNEGHWLLIVWVRTAAGTPCEYFIYDYTTHTWTTKQDLKASSPRHIGEPGWINFGQWIGTIGFQGTLAAVGVFDSVYDLANAEALKELESLSAWLTLKPLGLWLFNQLNLGEAVTDLTGNGADQVEQEGTEVLDESPPVPFGVTTPPESTHPAPSIKGRPGTKEKLKAEHGKWRNGPERYNYQWERAPSEEGPWEPIPGAEGEEYEPTEEDEGQFLRVSVEAEGEGGTAKVQSIVIGPIESYEQSDIGEPRGYPDWQDWLARVPEKLYENTALKLSESFEVGPIYVGDSDAINVWLRQTAGEKAAILEVKWHAEPADEQPMLVETFTIDPTAGELFQQLIAKAAHFTLVLRSEVEAGEGTYQLLVQSTNATDNDRRLDASVMLNEAALAVAPAETKKVVLARTAPGVGRLFVSATGEGATRTITLERLTNAGAWVRMIGFALPEKGQAVSLQFTMPASPIRFAIANGSAAGIDVDLVVGI